MSQPSASPEETRSALVAKILGRTEVPEREWLQDFASLLAESTLYVKAQQIVFDPANLPYFAVHLTKDGEHVNEAMLSDIFDTLVAHRVGLVVFIEGRGRLSLSHGHILSWQLYGTPYPQRFWDEEDDADGPQTLEEEMKVVVGPPNEEMLPAIVRDVLRTVMGQRFHIENPRVGLMREAGTNKASRIVFDIDPDTFGGVDAGYEVYKTLVWYMPYCIPSHYIPSAAGAEWMVPL